MILLPFFSCLAYLATLLSQNIAVHVNAAVEVNIYNFMSASCDHRYPTPQFSFVLLSLLFFNVRNTSFSNFILPLKVIPNLLLRHAASLSLYMIHHFSSYRRIQFQTSKLQSRGFSKAQNRSCLDIILLQF